MQEEQPMGIEQAKVRRSGTSLVITIPAHHVQRLDINEGSTLNVNWWSVTRKGMKNAGKMSSKNRERFKELFLDYIKKNPGCSSSDLAGCQPRGSNMRFAVPQIRYFVSGNMKDEVRREKGEDGKLIYYSK